MTATKDIQVTIAVSATAEQAFDAICRVSDWWASDLDGETTGLDSEFKVCFGETWVNFRITQFEPGRVVAWYVSDSNLPWLNDKTEWTGTTVRFEIANKGSDTSITLTHVGLHPGVECYENCNLGWNFYVGQSLSKLIADGQGMPNSRQGNSCQVRQPEGE